MDLKELKKDYETLSKKYSLPKFADLNENFEIDKIDKNTECVLRLIRKVMMEKIVSSLNFLEIMLNPANVPRIYLAYVRTMSNEDRKEIEKLYSLLGDLSLASLDLEIDYSEKKESEMIKNIYSVWQTVKPSFRKILSNIRKPNSPIVKKDSSYFG